MVENHQHKLCRDNTYHFPLFLGGGLIIPTTSPCFLGGLIIPTTSPSFGGLDWIKKLSSSAKHLGSSGTRIIMR